MEKYNIDPKSIGRLEVGTETLLDKSKSVKSVLMQLFAPHGNTSIEGVDTVNACYGGTNALFNAVNWVESSGWDGRDAIVVAGDIALYAKGNARPTGGAGIVAMLVGPDAALVLDEGKRGSYMAHAYDFYKPDLTSEYPYVDGHFSIRCYTEAVDAAYKAYNEREKVLAGLANGVSGEENKKTGVERFDYNLFHAPTCKLVEKSYARLIYNDYLANPDAEEFKDVPPEIKELSYEKSVSDKSVEKTFMAIAKQRYLARVKPGIYVPTNCGNMYCGSLYSALVSLIGNVDGKELLGKRIGLFSYGSGLASSFFSIRVEKDTSELAEKINLHPRLDARRVVEPKVFEEVSKTCILHTIVNPLTLIF